MADATQVSRRAVLAGALATGGALFVGGCRSAVRESSGQPSGSGGGGTLATGQIGDVNPAGFFGITGANYIVGHAVFNYLTKVSGTAMQPELATKWESRDGGRTFVMQLRRDVRFHSGRPMQARDVVFSLNQIADPKNASQAIVVMKDVEDVSATGKYEVTIRLREPTSLLPALFFVAPVVDQESFDELRSGEKVVGTGPFVWKSWKPGVQLDLARNDHYWQSGRPRLTACNLIPFANAQALATALRSRRVEFTESLPAREAATLNGDQVEVENDTSLPGEAYHLGLNVTEPPFDRLEVRQALGYALDRRRVLDQVFKGYGEVSCLWWPKQTPGWSADTAHHYEYDPDRAKRMLAQAGVAGLSVPLTANGGKAELRAVFDIVRYDLEQVGLHVKANLLEGNQFRVHNQGGDLGPMFVHRTGFGGLGPAACTLFSAPLRPDKGTTHFATDRYRKLIEGCVHATGDGLADANAALGSYMVDQAFNLNIVLGRAPIIHTPRLRGYEIGSAQPYLDLTDAYLG